MDANMIKEESSGHSLTSWPVSAPWELNACCISCRRRGMHWERNQSVSKRRHMTSVLFIISPLLCILTLNSLLSSQEGLLFFYKFWLRSIWSFFFDEFHRQNVVFLWQKRNAPRKKPVRQQAQTYDFSPIYRFSSVMYIYIEFSFV